MTKPAVFLLALSLTTLAASAVLAATVVVTPLHDAAPQPDADTVRGVTDLVTGILAEKVTVVSRDKLAACLSEQRLTAAGLADAKTAVRVGGLLKADYLLMGSVFRGKDDVKFAVQLVKIPSGEVAKGITVNGPPNKLLDTTNRLAAECAAALQIQVTAPPAEGAPAGRLATERYFLESLGYYYAENYDLAIMNCLKVIQLDPNHEKARLRLAESFLAAGETEQARITLHRALQVFPELAGEPRVTALLDKTDPRAIQAVEQEKVAVALPGDWPKDALVAYELTWEGQPARRDQVKAVNGAVTLDMPGARVPLDVRLTLATGGKSVARGIRLWPAAPPITAPRRRLVVVDPGRQVEPLLKNIDHQVYESCQKMAETETRTVIAPAATAKLTAETAKNIDAYIKAGGEVVVLGQASNGLELAGIKAAKTPWPMTKTWTARPRAAVFSYLPSADLAAALAHEPQAMLLSGGTAWFGADGGDVSLVSAARAGRLVWVAWPAEWDAKDPRCVRLAALALSDLLFEESGK